jgi:peptide methionine sulfoxide reductase msrA/msrB
VLRICFILNILFAVVSCAQETNSNENENSKVKTAVQTGIHLKINKSQMKTYNPLSKEEQKVILQKGTELPFTGEYVNNKEKGTYLCRQCNAPLYRSKDKFQSDCGWPSFDDEIKDAVLHKPDADGKRTEILCANCGAHLGHVFDGEGFTAKDIRHCVNSVSLRFIPAVIDTKPERAIFAAGCFWGVEYYLSEAPGVIHTTVGYMGGKSENPTYKEVCSHMSGHAEVVEVFFDPNITSFEKIAKLFFEIHDFTQVDRQGPDIGDQYRSEIFYLNERQKEVADSLINILKEKSYKPATKIEPASVFWSAEDYHQNYYIKNGSSPYCHIKKKIFD